jgi:uncharacterized protein (DUF4415 family)
MRARSSTSGSRTDWPRLRRASDREIDYGDIPPTSSEFWARAKVVRPVPKVPVSLRIDEDVVAWFRRRGRGYQTWMNAVLRAYAASHAGPAPRRRARRGSRPPH